MHYAHELPFSEASMQSLLNTCMHAFFASPSRGEEEEVGSQHFCGTTIPLHAATLLPHGLTRHVEVFKPFLFVQDKFVIRLFAKRFSLGFFPILLPTK